MKTFILALLLSAWPAFAQEPLAVREIGSLHIGGRIATVEGMETREIIFSPGAPPATADAARVRGIPHLVVWGDHIEGNAFWRGVRANVTRWQEQIRAAGGVAETLDLPAAGIAGSSHMMMMDTNSDEIAGRIQAWIATRGLMR